MHRIASLADALQRPGPIAFQVGTHQARYQEAFDALQAGEHEKATEGFVWLWANARTPAWYGVRYSFLFMRAEGRQLSEITGLIESGVIRPVIDKAYPFEKTGDALAYVETGRAKGKVVITVAD